MPIKQKATPINILTPNMEQLPLTIVGDRRLVCHNWSKKAIGLMKDKQTGKALKKKDVRNFKQEFKESLYLSTEGWHGFPCIAFKKSAEGAARYTDGITMVQVRGVIFVEPDGREEDGQDLVRIYGDKPRLKQDMCRIARGTANLTIRGEFSRWWTQIIVRFNANILSMEQVVNLYNLAGLHVGVGEGRPGAPSSTMDWGMFHVADTAEERDALFEAAGLEHAA